MVQLSATHSGRRMKERLLLASSSHHNFLNHHQMYYITTAGEKYAVLIGSVILNPLVSVVMRTFFTYSPLSLQ